MLLKCIDDIIQVVAFQHSVQIRDRQSNPMVGHPILRKVVRPDLLAAVCALDDTPAGIPALCLFFDHFAVEQPGAEDLPGFRSILKRR